MSQRINLNLGQGDWHQGFPGVTAQLWEADSIAPIQFTGSLPPHPTLGQQYERWRSLYTALYGDNGTWRQHRGEPHPRKPPQERTSRPHQLNDSAPERHASFDIEIEEDDITNVSASEFTQLGDDLRHQLNTWLESKSFQPIDRKLRTRLSPNDEIRVMIAANDHHVLRFPWRLWHLFEDYPRAELALSPVEYTRSVKVPKQTAIAQVTVLAILGNAQDIDVETDQQLLSALPGASVTVLAEPSLDDLNHQLWQGAWDILFFAGHSFSHEGSAQGAGVLQLNHTDCITIDQLKYGLRTAIAHGLQLAIFNSCDGLGLAWDLADLHIPQVIVMREPVPDRIAHAFLKHLIITLSSNQPLYLAVRAAREQLQPLEQDCPCATWLPVIVQNPAEIPLTWAELQGSPPSPAPPSPTPSPPTPPHPSPLNGSHLLFHLPHLLTPILLTVAILTIRFLGLLQPLELLALDRLMQLRPAESPDDRFLIITLNEADIQAQAPERRSSLSDEALEQLMMMLEQHEARVVGLDIYRDYPVAPTYSHLEEQMRQGDRLVGICKGRDSTVDPTGVAPPPELAEEFVGFSDFVEDSDGLVRRHLISMDADPIATCTTPYAFSARLAFLYLQSEGLIPAFNVDGNLVIGDVVFPRLHPRGGGYQPVDAGGTQLLLNYRALPSPQQIAQHVSLTQMLEGRVNPAAIANRVVLIGVTANSVADYWATPYGAAGRNKTAGIFMQAQMTSQLISAVLDGRPVLRTTPIWVDLLWISGWAIAGGAIAIYVQHVSGGIDVKNKRRSLRIILFGGLGLGFLTGGCLWLLVQGYWVPLLPAALAFVSSGGIVLVKRPDYE